MEPVLIDETLTRTVIGRSVDYFEDTRKSIAFKTILDDQTSIMLPWVKSYTDNLGFGFKEAVYWVRLTLKNPTRKDLEFFLHQEYPLADKLTLYAPGEKGAYTVIETGMKHPFAQRPYDYKSFVFPLTIKAGSSNIYYLRYDSHGSINIPLSVVSPGTFETNKGNEAVFFWMFYGIFAVMFIFNLFVFLSTRERSYLYYCMYIASFGLFTMSLGGMGFQYLYPDNPAIGKMPISITMAILIFSIIQFALHFINVKSLSKIWHYILKITAVIACILLGIAVISWNYFISIISTNLLTGVAATLGMVSTIYFAFFRKSRQAFFFVASFTLFLIGIIVVVLYYRGIVPGTVLTINGIYIGAVFQVITLSLGLADKINSMKNELGVLNAALEQKVDSRTAELQAANEEMTVMNRRLLDVRDALWSEMQLAKKIQTVLIPEKPSIRGYEISTFMRPADDVGGDYYDVINTGGMDWIVIGDVSGHGVPAGLVMMMVQTSINTVLNDRPGLPPSEVLMQVNRTIFRNIRKLGDDRYMTATVLAAHAEGRFIFSGLHQDMLVYREATRDVEMMDTDGMWIGIMDDLKGKITDGTFIMQKGDVLLLFTDGITEAWEKGTVRDVRNAGEKMFGDERLKRVFAENAVRPVNEIKNSIVEALENYDCTDDVTMVVLRRVS